ncbi:hypothetical protein HPB48_022159 [Haemaphysalis longicornis]|uniref:Uncharacterized protein n=1 Tax=Haemaphysalis longicornis TaxID=44386 RepID=A0A9J6H427_HAELO|nr:hypothetical protein HPB48_022159 [Haemaphysalis longicornis]
MYQGVLANFKSTIARRVLERLLIDVRSASNSADLNVPLVKAIFFILESVAWRDVKSQTILHCFRIAGFSRCSSGAGDEEAAGYIADAAGGAAAAIASREASRVC